MEKRGEKRKQSKKEAPSKKKEKRRQERKAIWADALNPRNAPNITYIEPYKRSYLDFEANGLALWPGKAVRDERVLSRATTGLFCCRASSTFALIANSGLVT